MAHSYDKPISTRLLLSAAFAVAFFFWVSYQSHIPHDHSHGHEHTEEAHGDMHEGHDDGSHVEDYRNEHDHGHDHSEGDHGHEHSH